MTVSLVRIKGTDCKAVELGQVSNKTGGQVHKKDNCSPITRLLEKKARAVDTVLALVILIARMPSLIILFPS